MFCPFFHLKVERDFALVCSVFSGGVGGETKTKNKKTKHTLLLLKGEILKAGLIAAFLSFNNNVRCQGTSSSVDPDGSPQLFPWGPGRHVGITQSVSLYWKDLISKLPISDECKYSEFLSVAVVLSFKSWNTAQPGRESYSHRHQATPSLPWL